MSDTRKLCTVTVEGHWLGLDVTHVEEVLQPGPSCDVPLSPTHVTGLCNLRGNILMIWDLRRVLGLPGTTQEPCIHVVVQQNGDRLALAVDEVRDVVTVESSSLSDAPTNVPEPLRSLLDGVYLSDEGLLLVLNADRTLGSASVAQEV